MVTLCTFPSVGWVKYDVLFIIIYAIFCTVIVYMFFTYLCFCSLFSSLILLFLACVFVCLPFLVVCLLYYIYSITIQSMFALLSAAFVPATHKLLDSSKKIEIIFRSDQPFRGC
jgi:hypothetical protein